MSDLIKRQDAIDALTEANLKSHMDSVEGGQENRSAIRIIMELPSVERKRGKWIQIEDVDANGNALYECPFCHKSDCHAVSQIVSYCWNCGAEMRERREDEC